MISYLHTVGLMHTIQYISWSFHNRYIYELELDRSQEERAEDEEPHGGGHSKKYCTFYDVHSH